MNKHIIKMVHDDFLNLIKQIPDNSIDFILTDPPYGTTNAKWDTVIPFVEMWQELNRVIKKDKAIALFGSEPFSSLLRASNIDNFKYDFYWIKNKSTNFLNAKKQPLRNIEIISIFNSKFYYPQKSFGHKPVNAYTKTKKSELYNKTKDSISGGGSTERYPNQSLFFDVVNNDNSSGDKFHPTQKPVDLLEYLIKTYTQPNETVLDFTSGSFSTAMACLNTKRNFIGFEIDKRFFHLGINRIDKNLTDDYILDIDYNN